MDKISDFFRNCPCFRQGKQAKINGVVDLVIDVPVENLRSKGPGGSTEDPYILACALSKPMRDAAIKKILEAIKSNKANFATIVSDHMAEEFGERWICITGHAPVTINTQTERALVVQVNHLIVVLMKEYKR